MLYGKATFSFFYWLKKKNYTSGAELCNMCVIACMHIFILTALISEEVPSRVLRLQWEWALRAFPCYYCCFFVFLLISGFNVGRSAGGRSTVREINRDACHFPGFPVLQSLLPKHTNVPALYFLLMALFLQQPVTELPENLQVSAPVVSSRCKQGCQVGIIW